MRTRNSGNSEAKKDTKLLGYSCPVCGATLPGPGWDHCDGSAPGVGYAQKIKGSHHVRRVPGPNGMETQIYANCFLCFQPMGCPLCSVCPICKRCLVIVDRDFFVARGPLSNDSYSVAARGGRKALTATGYPGSWVNDYILANPETWNKTDEELYLNYRNLVIRLSQKMRMAKAGVRVSDKELELRRNAQVEQLTEAQLAGR